MKTMTWLDEDARRSLWRQALAWAVVVTAGHLALGATGGGIRHGLHILLAALYFIPVIFAALARGVAGGVLVAAAVGAAYLLHVAWRQPEGSGQVLDELAVVAAYLALGGVTGLWASEADRRRRERDAVLAAAARSEARSGLDALVEALSARDPELGAHSRRVAELAELIARRMDLGREARADVHLAGLLHDLGKIGLHDDVLFSNGALSPEQMDAVRSHPWRAAELVRAVGGSEELAEAVLAHHECPDGTGYPRGLAGDRIPLLARIVRASDVFVALTEGRAYRSADSLPEAIGRVRAMAPAQLDSSCVAALEALVRDGWWAPSRAPASDPTPGMVTP